MLKSWSEDDDDAGAINFAVERVISSKVSRQRAILFQNISFARRNMRKP